MTPDTTPAIASDPNGYSIGIGDNPQIVLKGIQGKFPYGVFMVTLGSSTIRDGQPVRCTNFLRGVSLLLESTMPPVPGEKAEPLFDFIYSSVESPLKAWLQQELTGEPFCQEILGLTVRFAHNSHLAWLPGVAQVDVEEPCSIEDFIASPPPDTGFTPLSSDWTPPRTAPTQARRPWREETVVPQRGPSPAVKRALDCNIQALTRAYSRIPFPVRFRATGALQAWAEVRRAAGAPGARMERALADARIGPCDLVPDYIALVDPHSTASQHPENLQQLSIAVSVSLPSQAFWLRKGALFEPTDALEQLLKLSDVGDDMPLAAAVRGARALCIVPGPGLRQEPDCVDSIMIFDHSGPSAEGASERWLTFVVPRESMTKENRLSLSQMRIQIDDESMTIRQAVGRYFRSPDDALDDEDGPGFWTRVLSYVFKVLFYLSSEQPRITQDNAYSNAPRNFSGLGKRRKNERLQEIEQLYDRYIVGPEVLPSLHQRGAAHADTGEGGEVSPHWRRGHFRVQRHGAGFSMRRVVFIMPVIVRADLLNSDGVH